MNPARVRLEEGRSRDTRFLEFLECLFRWVIKGQQTWKKKLIALPFLISSVLCIFQFFSRFFLHPSLLCFESKIERGGFLCESVVPRYERSTILSTLTSIPNTDIREIYPDV
jgi:hypothetical protein